MDTAHHMQDYFTAFHAFSTGINTLWASGLDTEFSGKCASSIFRTAESCTNRRWSDYLDKISTASTWMLHVLPKRRCHRTLRHGLKILKPIICPDLLSSDFPSPKCISSSYCIECTAALSTAHLCRWTLNSARKQNGDDKLWSSCYKFELVFPTALSMQVTV
jgi:hypothetical protein